MKKYKDIGIYDFSDYAEEITGDALFKINGGAEVQNSHEGVANAQAGDTMIRNDGTVVVLKQADIDYAQQQLGNTGNTGASNTSSNSGNKNNSSSSSNNTGTSSGSATSEIKKEEKKAPSPAVMYDSHDPSRVFVDLDNPKAMQQAADLLADPSLGLRVTAYGSESGITKNFKNYQEINDYLVEVHPFDYKISVALAKDENGYAKAFFFEGQIVNNPMDGNVNINTNFGFVRADIPLFDSDYVSVDLNLQSMTASALVGMQGNRVGVDADVAIVKGGINIAVKLNEKKLNINAEGEIGYGASVLVGRDGNDYGLKAGCIPGYGGSLSVYISEE